MAYRRITNTCPIKNIAIGQVGGKRSPKPHPAARNEGSTAESKDDRTAADTTQRFSVAITKGPPRSVVPVTQNSTDEQSPAVPTPPAEAQYISRDHSDTEAQSPAMPPTIPPPKTESASHDQDEGQPPDTLASVVPPSVAIEPVIDNRSDQSPVSGPSFVVPQVAVSAPPPLQTAPVRTPFPVSPSVASVASAAPEFSSLVPETPRRMQGRTSARGGHDAAAAVKVLVPETPRRMQLFSFPAIGKDALRVPLEIPQVMPSAPGADDCLEWEHSLGQAAEVVLGTGCVERLRAGESITFRVFPKGFDRCTMDLLVAEVGMYIYHSPVGLGREDVLRNMVHSVLQQAVRQSLSVWVVAALLYRTERVIAIPLPAVVSVKDGLWDFDESHIFDASVSLTEGIRQSWTGLHMEPVWYPDDVNPTVGSVRIGTNKQWSGLQAIQQAYVSLGAVQLDEEGFIMSDFSDSFAMPAILPCSISRALLGAVSWEHQSVNHFLASTRTMGFFSSELQAQTEFAPGLAAAAARVLRQEYIRFGRSSWVVACAKAGRMKDAGWLSTITTTLGDQWVEARLGEEGAETTAAASGAGAKRAANFTDSSPLAKKAKV